MPAVPWEKLGMRRLKVGVHPPLEAALLGDAQLDQPQTRPRRQIARGGIVHRAGHVEEIEAGPGGAGDDVRDASPLTPFPAGCAAAWIRSRQRTAALRYLSSPVSWKTRFRVKPMPATPS